MGTPKLGEAKQQASPGRLPPTCRPWPAFARSQRSVGGLQGPGGRGGRDGALGVLGGKAKGRVKGGSSGEGVPQAQPSSEALGEPAASPSWAAPAPTRACNVRVPPCNPPRAPQLCSLAPQKLCAPCSCWGRPGHSPPTLQAAAPVSALLGPTRPQAFAKGTPRPVAGAPGPQGDPPNPLCRLGKQPRPPVPPSPPAPSRSSS